MHTQRLRRTLLLIGVGVLAIGVTPAAAWVPGDSVFGYGSNNPPNPANVAEFVLGVTSGPHGENPKGFVLFRTVATKALTGGIVTCMNVSGPYAVIGVDVRLSTTSDPLKPKGLLVYVVDGGPTVAGQSPDEIRTDAIFTGDVPKTCPTPVDPNRMTLQKGAIKVIDN